MTTTPDAPALQPTAHRGEGQALIARVRFYAAMAASALIFWHIGWAVVGPDDPRGPVTLLMLNNSVVGIAELFGLSVAAAGLATAICGPRSAHRGPQAVAVGLAALALRGGFMDEFIRRRIADRLVAPSGTSVTIFPKGEFIAETWLWIILIGVGFVVGRWVESWHSVEANSAPAQPGATSAASSATHAPAATPVAAAHLDSAAEVRQGLAALVLNVLVAYNLIIVLSGGRIVDEMQKGQIYASVGGAFFISTLVSHLCFKANSRVWLLVAAAVVSTTAYVWNSPSPAALSGNGYVVLPPLLRALPIEYAALSVAGALAGFNLRERLTAGTIE